MKTFKQIFLSKDKTKNKKAFTLVELIIVITIIWILSVIWFVSFWEFNKNARDGNRLETLTNLRKWLNLYVMQKRKYPLPENQTWTWMIGWEIVSYVWEIWDNISKKINFKFTPKDPLSDTNYIYATDVSRYKYQIATVLEKTQANNMLVNTVYAADSYTAKVVGNYSWLLKTKTKVYNLPSLIFTNTWVKTLTDSDTNFIVDKLSNLPYKIGKVKILNTLSTTWVLEKMTGTVWATLTWVIKPQNMLEFNTMTWTLSTLWYKLDIIWQEILWNNYDVSNTATTVLNTLCTTPNTAIYWWLSYTLTSQSLLSWNSIVITSSDRAFWTNPANGVTSAKFTFRCNGGVITTTATASNAGSCSTPFYVFNN